MYHPGFCQFGCIQSNGVVGSVQQPFEKMETIEKWSLTEWREGGVHGDHLNDAVFWASPSHSDSDTTPVSQCWHDSHTHTLTQ